MSSGLHLRNAVGNEQHEKNPAYKWRDVPELLSVRMDRVFSLILAVN